ncbi:MAG TPA: FkbM family methyltransferase [Caulobacteraceae bacterium]|nr:FkbM family methyltransferase [Caulobacteraceae bacterium]
MSLVASAFRAGLRRAGYDLVKPEFARFGTSLFVDVGRICREWDWLVEVVFDVGANVGQFAAEALAGFPAARIHSFEPFPLALAKLTAALSDPRLTTHELALGDARGETTLYAYGAEDETSHINSLVPDARFPRRFGYTPREVRVRADTVDLFCQDAGIERIDVLKVDTEGFDLFVLKGAKAMLEAGRIRFVYVEFNDLFEVPGATGGALIPIAEYLRAFGYAYLVTYTDFVLYERRVAVNANALFALPPVAMRAPASLV